MALVGVMPDKRIAGADSLAAPGLLLNPGMSLKEALTTEWESDAHLLPYHMVVNGTQSPSWPRCNKPVLTQLREAGGDLHFDALCFDYDNPGHADWSPEMRKSFELQIVEAADFGLPLAMQWSYLYFTRGGARFVYELDKTISAEQYEGTVRGVVRDFLSYGISIDPLFEWNRLFRLPKVTREGTKTWEADYFELLEQTYRLDPDTIIPGEVTEASKYADIHRLSLPLPDPDTAKAALTDTNRLTGRNTKTYWYKQAKKQLQGRDCYPTLFENAPMASPGGRHSAIQRLVGEAIALLYPAQIAGTTVEIIYALFFDSLEQLNAADPGDPEDFLVTGWAAILEYWSREEAKWRYDQGELQAQQTEYKENQTNLTMRIMAGVRSWAEGSVPKDDNEAILWLSEHMVVATASHFHVMMPSGFYDPIGVTAKLLVARIREMRVDTLIPLVKVEDGKTKPVQAQEIIDRHATTVAGIEGAVGVPGTLLRNVGQSTSTLVHRLYCRKSLEPKWDPEVDMWLQMLLGTMYHKACDWVAHALNFEGGPICALSLSGKPGVGKKLFYQGLAECIDTEVVASSKDFGDFQGLLMRTPFLVINEGMVKLNGSMHPADTFRHMVSGDPLYVVKKFCEPVQVRNPLRVMFFANNMDVVQALTGNRDLSPEDREALALRIFHIDADPKAEQWIRHKGGLEFTRGWINADSGERGSYRVARHFLFLYANRSIVKKGNRLLIEGNMSSQLIRQMSTRSGTAPVVIEVLIRMVETEGYLDGFVIDNTALLVTTSAIVDFYRQSSLKIPNVTLNHRTVGKVLKGLVVEQTINARTVATARGSKKAKWREIDSGLLLEEAVEHGYQCKKLEKIAMGRAVVTEAAARAVEEIQNAY